jgi:hypothetical protein
VYFTFPFNKWLEESEKDVSISDKSYSRVKFDYGEFTWSRYWALVMLKWELKRF